MKEVIRKFRWLFVGMLVLSVAPLQAQIVGSKHDLSADTVAAGTTSEVCVFCHTPHGSNTTAEAPLWNRTLPDETTYTRYSTTNSTTFDSTNADVGSVSLACLSCHDGSIALDQLINKPGSGGYNSAGSLLGTLGTMSSSLVANLGTDLVNDHPISMQYAGGGVTSSVPTPATTVFGDPDFKAVSHATVNGANVWWVDSPVGTAGTREKTDMQLYTRTISSVIQPTVECGSCHDPHNASSFDDTAGLESVSFLRIKNSDSQVCTTCHNK